MTATHTLALESYSPPAWAKSLPSSPAHRVRLALAPTPVHPWQPPGLPTGVQAFIKRDDLTGAQLSGNKVRKLEFLLAAARAGGHDSVVTLGGVQSNHARATAAAARLLGLEPHLVLRTGRTTVQDDPGLIGNLLVDRLAGAQLHMVTKEEYGAWGHAALGQELCDRLIAQGHSPYLVPMGGTNALGTWGYLEAFEELRPQLVDAGITDIIMACGSGGTTAGVALANHLSGAGMRVHAYAVCDTPAYFYAIIDKLVAEVSGGAAALPPATQLVNVIDAKGAGYAISQREELETLHKTAQTTGIILDPVYTGKALHGWLRDVAAAPEAWQGRRVLFLHTGGLLGTYDKAQELLPLLQADQAVHRMQGL